MLIALLSTAIEKKAKQLEMKRLKKQTYPGGLILSVEYDVIDTLNLQSKTGDGNIAVVLSGALTPFISFTSIASEKTSTLFPSSTVQSSLFATIMSTYCITN